MIKLYLNANNYRETKITKGYQHRLAIFDGAEELKR